MGLFADLPLDVLSIIFDKIGSFHILYSAQFVCKEWHAFSLDPHTWKCINGCKLNYKDLKVVVDRSDGCLIEYDASTVYLEWKDMEYIFERSPKLEKISFQCNGWLQPFLEDQFTIASIRCPSLKNIEIDVYSYNFCYSDIECIGRLFPNLEKFRLEKDHNFGWTDEIARNMGGLFELQLKMSNIVADDLRTILDGCPKLQFLGVVTNSTTFLLDDDVKERLKRLQGYEIYNIFEWQK
ncbi:hypothetical protein ZOSMA_171G00570 [Zostera marina]|uniref:F-box domain-containing protein n=1 Tax=Zostera marina TaxID=29655 RepID=A0A0K9PSM2_ZOSMR|nr:hypothetical protein ZOSMA_171G00570 [Zostera marina]